MSPADLALAGLCQEAADGIGIPHGRPCVAKGNHRIAQNDEPEPGRHLAIVRKAIAARSHEQSAIAAHHAEERAAGLDSSPRFA
ncbi:hypothetical protein [uncultured Ramlibacter sp.]|uniref:hypothetical protein n=1 Tax=uncultured Ramlibacter sp. TaxID=260755 RepID=UPI00260FFA41|nr:hypothetical protein [uncultured Ramlibacter sp.]